MRKPIAEKRKQNKVNTNKLSQEEQTIRSGEYVKKNNNKKLSGQLKWIVYYISRFRGPL